MISQIAGRLITKSVDRAEVMTAGGTGYELAIPLTLAESLPAPGADVSLHTHLVVKDDGWQLYAFASAFERQVFRTILVAKGVGPALALNLLSTLTAERLVRAIRDRDILTLQTVPRVGRKKAEQLVLDVADRLDQLYETATAAPPRGVGAEDAVRGLVQLGYSRGDAERAVRVALEKGPGGRSVTELIRAALAAVA